MKYLILWMYLCIHKICVFAVLDVWIECVSNCPLTDPRKKLVIKYNCPNNCSELEGRGSKWTYLTPRTNIRYHLERVHKHIYGRFLEILEDSLYVGDELTFLMRTANRDLEARIIVNITCPVDEICRGQMPLKPEDEIDDDAYFQKEMANASPTEIEEKINKIINNLKAGINPLHKFYARSQKEIMYHLMNMPLNTQNDVSKAKKILEFATTTATGVLTSGQAAAAAMLQKKITEAQLNIVKKALQPGGLSQEIDAFSNEVLQTISKVTEIEPDIQSDVNFTGSVSNDDILENENFPTENYPVYLDFDILSEARQKNIEKTTWLATNIVADLGKCALLTMKNMTERKETINQGTCILNILYEKKQTKEQLYSICNTTLLLTTPLLTELNSKQTSIAITFSVIHQKLFDWMIKQANAQYVFLDILDLYSDADVIFINEPVIFSTPLNLTIGDAKFNTFEMTAKDFGDIDIITHKLFIFSYLEMVVITFSEMDPADEFRVVVTVNRRPNIKDFSSYKPIPNDDKNLSNKYVILQKVNASANSLCYVGILPEMGSNTKKTFAYKVKFTKIGCDIWLADNLVWNSLFCKVGGETTLERVTCYCNHLSLYASVAEDLNSEIVYNTISDVYLNDSYCYYVLGTLGVVILIFFLLFVIIMWRNRHHLKTKVVLLLLDNDLTFKHEYYVVVYTGIQTNAQTTSNITFKIYGSKSTSLLHLLKGQHEPVFQNGSEDWFYLLTEKDLGEITAIDLWSDCYGCRSSWYCDKIEVYQISTGLKWLFQVRNWISAINHKVIFSTKVITVETPTLKTRGDFALRGLREHLWIRSFQKCTFPTFSYSQRIVTMLSIVICNMSMCLCLLEMPTADFISMKLGYGEYYIGGYEFGLAFASSVISFIMHTFVIYVFSNAEPFHTAKILSTANTTLRKPWRIVTWIILLIILLGNIAVLSVIGLWVDFMSSLVWLTTWAIAVALCIVVYETITCMIISAIQKKFDDVKLKLDISEIATTKQKLQQKYGNQSLRPFFKSYYSPISKIEESMRMEFELQRAAARRLCNDILMFSIYLVVLFLVVLLNKDSTTHLSGRDVEKMMIFDKYGRSYGTAGITTQKGLYHYLNYVLVPNLYCTKWYGRYITQEGGLVVNFNTKMLGVPRLRQKRIKNNTCDVVYSMRNVTKLCNLEYNFAIEETRDFAAQWNTKIYDGTVEDTSDQVWKYQSASVTNARHHRGDLSSYTGGGYVATLGRTKNNTIMILRYIEHRQWIDLLTRVIFIDVNFYNANENLFNMLAIIIEKSASGKFIVNYILQSTRLLYLDPVAQVIKFSTLLLLMLFLLIFSWYKIKHATRTKHKKLRQALQIWNMVDLLIVLLAICFTGMFFYRSAVVNDLLESLENARHNEYVSFNTALYLDFVVDILAAILVTISTIRLWKLLRFLKIFRVVELTIHTSWIYLLSFTAINIVVFFTYGIVGHMIFGSSSADFKDLSTSILTVILLAFQFHPRFNYNVFINTKLNIGYIYYMSSTVTFLIIVSIFVTLIMVSYQAAKEVYEANLQDELVHYNILNFIQEEYRYFNSKTCGRLDEQRLSAGIENITQTLQDDPEVQTTRKGNVSRKKVAVSEKRIADMMDIFAKAYSLLKQTPIRERNIMEIEDIVQILSYSLKKKPSKRFKKGTKLRIFIPIPFGKTITYCSYKRMEDMKLIVQYLLNRQKNKDMLRCATSMRLQTQQDVDPQERMIIEMNAYISDSIKVIKVVMNKTYADKSTNVFFEDLGLEEVFD